MVSFGLASLLMWASYPDAQIQAQVVFNNPQSLNREVQAAAMAGVNEFDHTINLTKMVEIYEFEGLKVAVDQYKVNRGDSLIKVLQSRGLIKSGLDQPRMLRMVKDLNPELKNVDSLMPGQMVTLPLLLTQQQIEAAEGMLSAQAEAEAASAPAQAEPVFENFVEKEYQRPADSQKPAKVRIMRSRSSFAGETTAGETMVPAHDTQAPEASTMAADGFPPPAHSSNDDEAALALSPAKAGPEAAEAPALSASQGAFINYASGNSGDLNVETDSGVVYRTVKIRKGDSLERLLRREGMHRDLIYAHLLKVTMQLNPDIKNPDLIIAGAEIRLPAAGDYLASMAGADPGEVRSAAAVAGRRLPSGGGTGGGQQPASPKAAVASLPNEATESAKQALALIFTRLGERVDSRGQAILRGDDGRGVGLNTSDFPVIQLSSGVRLVLDPGARLSQSMVNNLRSLSPPVQVFKTGKKENLDRALERLWALCGFYRVFNHERTYEGGGDIKLKISADWMIWPTEQAWAAGQPLVINRLRNGNQRTDPAWAAFLEDHGIMLVDIHKNLLLPSAGTPPAKPALPVLSLNSSNPSLLAAELLRHLGIDEPKVGVQLDMAQQLGNALPDSLTAPVLWETDKGKFVLEFGELTKEAVKTLRQRGYKVVSAQKDSDSVIRAVLDSNGLKIQNNLTISAPAGGPKMSLHIKGRLVSTAGRSFLITQTVLPSGLSNLFEPGLTVISY